MTIFAAALTVAVLVNVTGEPLSPSTAAVVVYVTSAEPRVRVVSAVPCALVAVVVGDTDPSSLAVQVTATFATQLLLASVTLTAERIRPAPRPAPQTGCHR